MTKVDRAIKKTIDYAKKYNCRLTAAEIYTRLISGENYNQKDVTKRLKLFENELSNGRENKYLEEKIKKAERLVKEYLIKISDIMMVGITGSVAALHPKADDDIDIMIITKKNKLWKTRLKLRWLIYKNKIPHRRYGYKERKNEFCFNLWLEEDSLKIPQDKQNLKNAIDLILMIPKVNRNRTYEKFIMINKWAEKYAASGYKKIEGSLKNKVKNENRPDLWVNRLINTLFYIPQVMYMRPKLGKGKVGRHYAFFHP